MSLLLVPQKAEPERFGTIVGYFGAQGETSYAIVEPFNDKMRNRALATEGVSELSERERLNYS